MRLEGDLRLEFTADMRFVGQAFEVPVPFDPDELDRLTAEDVARRFAEAHHRVYFFGGEASRPVEFVSFRLGVTAPLAELPLLAETEAGPRASTRQIELFDRGRWTEGRLVGRAAVGRGPGGARPGAARGPDLDRLRPRRLVRRARRQRQHDHAEGAPRCLRQRRARPALDPVDYAVISQALTAAAREMGVKLIRSSYSNIVREAQDGSAALFDRQGNVVAQAELIPMQLGPMSDIFRACAAVVPPDRLGPGDFYINNDPYSGGQHLQDVFIYSPIFVDGELVGFAGSVSHHLDLGGGNPGLTPNAADVHAEGLIFPPSVYNVERDWNGGNLERLIASNIRAPDQTIGDFYAQFAANAVGAERVMQLCRRYGVGKVTRAMTELIDYSERRFRAAVAAIPDGDYEGEDAVDDDGTRARRR